MAGTYGSCTILKQISYDHRYPDEPFAALADLKLIIKKARKQAHRELLRNTPGSPSALLTIAATALRAYRSRHLGTLMHCCAAWELVGKCLDQWSFECIDFHGLARLLLASREKELQNERQQHTTYLGLRRKKTTPWPNADSACEHGVPRNRCGVSMRLPTKTVILLKMRMSRA